MATGWNRFAELPSQQAGLSNCSQSLSPYIDALQHYYFVGGMPEAVQCFTENADFNGVHAIQKKMLATYEQDFSKHAGVDAPLLFYLGKNNTVLERHYSETH